MFAIFQYLIALLVAETPATPGTAADAVSLPGIAAVVGAYVVLCLVAARLLSGRVARDREAAALAARRTLLAGRCLALSAFWLVVNPLGGRHLPGLLGVQDWVLVPLLVRLLPFVAMTVALGGTLHRPLRALGFAPPTRREALASGLRMALVPLAPIGLLLVVYGGLQAVLTLAPGSAVATAVRLLAALEVVQLLFTLAIAFLALLLVPFAVRIAWRATPLPPGPLRDRLQAYADRVRLRARDLLVWPTGGTQLNAAVIGALPRFRYVVLTDALLTSLDADEIEAVLAHEAGHARRGHVLLFFGFTAVLVLAHMLPGALAFADAVGLSDADPLLRTLVAVGLWFGVVFGWVSRRFEQEADVFGLETLPRPAEGQEHPFVRALERIAAQVGGIREVTGWRHFSISDRVGFVRGYLADAGVRARYRRSIFLLRWGLIGTVAAFALLVGLRLPGEIARGRVLWRTLRRPESFMLQMLDAGLAPADAAMRAANLSAAAAFARRAAAESGQDRPHLEAAELRWLREAARLAPGDHGVLTLYADALERAGRPHGAHLAWSRVAADGDAPAPLRERAAARAATLLTGPAPR